MIEAGDGVTVSGVGTSAQPYIIDVLGSGASVAWDAVSEPEINLTATGDAGLTLTTTSEDDPSGIKLIDDGTGGIHLLAQGTAGGIQLDVSAENGTVSILANGTDGNVSISSSSINIDAVDGDMLVNLQSAANLTFQAAVPNSNIAIEALGDTSNISISADGADSNVNISASGTGGSVNVAASEVGGMVVIDAGGDVELRGFDTCSIGGDDANAVVECGPLGIQLAATKLGFFGSSPVDQPTGVAVDAAGIHAALVALGLITA